MDGHDDRRKQARHGMDRTLKVFRRDTGEVMGTVANINTDGILLVSSKPLEVPHTYVCKMSLPEEQFLTKELYFDAQTVWSEQASTPDLYRTGMQLTNISPEERSMIELVIREYTGQLA